MWYVGGKPRHYMLHTEYYILNYYEDYQTLKRKIRAVGMDGAKSS